MQCRNLRAWLIIFIVFDQSKSQSSKGRDIVTMRKIEGGGENQWEETRLISKQDFS